MRKHHDDQANTEPLEERAQRDQKERSKQALSNQGSQGRKPNQANPDHDRGTADSSRDKPA